MGRAGGWRVLVCGLGVLIGGRGLAVAQEAAQTEAEADAIDERIRAEVAKLAPEAVDLFDQANEARDGGDLSGALELYQKAIALAPALDHLSRRACGVLVQLERAGEAVPVCERALELRPDSGFNQTALAHALIKRRDAKDLPRALELARGGASANPREKTSLGVWCLAAEWAQDARELRTCTETYLALDPDDLQGNMMMLGVQVVEGDLGMARQFLEKAHRVGLPDDDYERVSAELSRMESTRDAGRRFNSDPGGAESPGRSASQESWGRSASQESALVGPLWRFLRAALLFIGVWLAVMAALLLAGWILSRLTLRAAERVVAAGEVSGDGTDRERSLRRVYKLVVLLCGAYFYLSAPVLLFSILLAGGGVIALFVAAGHIPIKVLILVGVGVFVTIGAILRGLFARRLDGELGLRIELDESPRFRELLDDVARAIDTRPVDSVYITPHTDMAVTERGGLWRSVSGKATERCLILGVGLLDGMKQLDLRSVLAHEYGHFRNQDTAGGGFALAVRRSLSTMVVSMAASGAATWYNPAWLFLRAYMAVYLVVSQGASRLQEVLADRWAIRAYGSRAFVRGYTHVVERSVRFEVHTQHTLSDAIEQKLPLPNLYRAEPVRRAGGDEPDPAAVEADLIADAMAREPSAYDSHPAPGQRLAWAEAMAVERDPAPDDELPVWELFADRDALERRMTEQVRQAVADNHGIRIPAEATLPRS